MASLVLQPLRPYWDDSFHILSLHLNSYLTVNMFTVIWPGTNWTNRSTSFIVCNAWLEFFEETNILWRWCSPQLNDIGSDKFYNDSDWFELNSLKQPLEQCYQRTLMRYSLWGCYFISVFKTCKYIYFIIKKEVLEYLTKYLFQIINLQT